MSPSLTEIKYINNYTYILKEIIKKYLLPPHKYVTKATIFYFPSISAVASLFVNISTFLQLFLSICINCGGSECLNVPQTADKVTKNYYQ